MKRIGEFHSPDSPEAAARVVASMLVRDGRIDWREIHFLERSGALNLLGLPEKRFSEILAAAIKDHCDRRAAGRPSLDPELDSIRSRRLQLVVAALLVYITEIDREIRPEESSLVRRVFSQWDITPAELRDEMNVPVFRSDAALYGGRLPSAAAIAGQPTA